MAESHRRLPRKHMAAGYVLGYSAPSEMSPSIEGVAACNRQHPAAEEDTPLRSLPRLLAASLRRAHLGRAA